MPCLSIYMWRTLPTDFIYFTVAHLIHSRPQIPFETAILAENHLHSNALLIASLLFSQPEIC